MRHPQPLPPALGASFSVAAAIQAGVTERRLRHSGLEKPFWGVRALPAAAEGDPPYDESRAATEARVLRARIHRLAVAYATHAGDACFFSHATAAVLWSLPLPLRVLRRTGGLVHSAAGPALGIDVAVLAPRRAPKGIGVAGHALTGAMTSVRTIDGLQVTSPATTWAMMAPLLSIDELVRLGDAIVNVPRRWGCSAAMPMMPCRLSANWRPR